MSIIPRVQGGGVLLRSRIVLEGVPLNDMELHAAVGPRSLPGPVFEFIYRV